MALSEFPRTICSKGDAVNPFKHVNAPANINPKGKSADPKLGSTVPYKKDPIYTSTIPPTNIMIPCIKVRCGVFGSAKIRLCARWAGKMIKASNKLKTKHAITTKAISCIISRPSTNKSTENATIVVITGENRG